MISPQLEAISAKLGARARVAKLDSDLAPELSSRLRVEGLPTMRAGCVSNTEHRPPSS